MKEKEVSSSVIISIVAIIVVVAVGIGFYVATRGDDEGPGPAGGYPAISMNAVNEGDNGIKITVLSGSITAGEWAYSVSTTEGSYSWTTGTEALDAPFVVIATNLADGTYYVNVKHLDSGHIYFANDQAIPVPSP